MIPKKLKNYVAFVDGHGYAGLVKELTLPKLTLKTEEYRAGGMDIPVEIEMGMEKLEADMTLAQYDKNIIGLWGKTSREPVSMTVRGAQSDGNSTEAVVINLRGIFRELDQGAWKVGEESTMKVSVAVSYYKLSLDGSTLVEIDAENMRRIINGVDQLEGQRRALGI